MTNENILTTNENIPTGMYDGHTHEGVFYQMPQPFQSWTRDGAGGWVPPIPKQENDTWWNESAREWSTEPWLQQF